MKKTVLFAVAMVITVNAYAADGGTLRQVMQQLGHDYATLNQAILLEDFDQAEKSAHAIAEHDKPSMGQRMKIMAALGTEMMNFKKVDGEVHDLAVKVEEAAKGKDLPQLIHLQSQMLSACMACHTTYRSSVIKALNNQGEK